MNLINLHNEFPIYDNLSKNELEYSKKIYRYLKTKIGKSKAKTCEEIRMKTRTYFKLEEPTFRKIIHYLRLNVDASICACGKGYYMAETEQELNEFLESLKKRVNSQLTTIYHIENGIRKF